jgi:hypothetical protein
MNSIVSYTQEEFLNKLFYLHPASCILVKSGSTGKEPNDALPAVINGCNYPIIQKLS